MLASPWKHSFVLGSAFVPGEIFFFVGISHRIIHKTYGVHSSITVRRDVLFLSENISTLSREFLQCSRPKLFMYSFSWLNTSIFLLEEQKTLLAAAVKTIFPSI